jgi:hypothetical protein
MPDAFNRLYLDLNGNPTERRWLGGQEVIVHYVDIPEKDRTMVRGIPCTTALRTVIDIATSVDRDHLCRMIDDCLTRRLFTLEEARARLAEGDMARHPGAPLVRRALPT